MKNATPAEIMEAINEFSKRVLNEIDAEIVSIEAVAHDIKKTHQPSHIKVVFEAPTDEAIQAFLSDEGWVVKEFKFLVVGQSSSCPSVNKSLFFNISLIVFPEWQDG